MPSTNAGQRNAEPITLTSLAQSYIGLSLTVIHEFYGSYERRYRELRRQVTDEINPLLIQHGAEPIDVDLVPDPDKSDDDIEYDEAGNTWSG